MTENRDGVWTWTHSDHLHSATVITDADGTEVRRLAYTAFGEETENAGTGASPTYTYTAKEIDASGLMDYGARYYDPALSRFITADTVYDAGPQGLNRYSYALNNPIIYRDPMGHQVLDDGNIIDRNRQWRKHVAFLPDFLLDIFLPVTSEDVAGALGDQISGFVTIIPSGPGKKVVQETVEEGVKQGKKVIKEVLEESSDEVLVQGKKLVKEGVEQSGDEVIEEVSKKTYKMKRSSNYREKFREAMRKKVDPDFEFPENYDVDHMVPDQLGKKNPKGTKELLDILEKTDINDPDLLQAIHQGPNRGIIKQRITDYINQNPNASGEQLHDFLKRLHGEYQGSGIRPPTSKF